MYLIIIHSLCFVSIIGYAIVFYNLANFFYDQIIDKPIRSLLVWTLIFLGGVSISGEILKDVATHYTAYASPSETQLLELTCPEKPLTNMIECECK